MIDLKVIKKKYGEEMMHLCRDLFPTILSDNKGMLQEIMLNLFYPSHELINDIKGKEYEFQNYITKYYQKMIGNYQEKEIIVNLTPEELLRKKGYTLYECKSEDDIQKFKKYYAKGEELCTFGGGRLDTDYVYFAVKDNALELKREDFKNPKRQDEYGVSVISIQFSKNDSHYLSIKNRYNHKVDDPDATFSNNLDNIIEGLTESFAKFKGMKQAVINDPFELKGYTKDETGKYYKYNYEIDNVYYCPNNIIIKNNKARELPNWVILADYFIIDLKHKKILSYVDDPIFNNFTDIEDIKVTKEKDDKQILITHKNQEETKITLNKNNQITSFESNYIKNTGSSFLKENRYIQKIILPKCKYIGPEFMYYNETCEVFEVPICEEIGHHVLMSVKPKIINISDYARVEDDSFGGLYNVWWTI